MRRYELHHLGSDSEGKPSVAAACSKLRVNPATAD
jgi:hypothetical protein